MSLINALLERRDPVEERALTPSQLAWARGEDMASSYSPTGVTVNRDTLLGVSAVWACVSLISDSIATLPAAVYGPGAPAKRLGSQPDWLDVPNPEQTIVDFKFGTVASLLLDGYAPIYTVRDRKGDVVEAYGLDPRWVQVRREFQPDGTLKIVYYVQVARGQQSPVGPFRVVAGPDMFHINAMQIASNIPVGIGPLDVARMMFGSAIAGQEMGGRWFSQGFNAAGVIEHPDDLTIDQAKQLKTDFKQANTGGPSRMHLPPVLTAGATWKQIQISPEQAQFLEQRLFAVDEIARWFRVPPHMIGNLEKTTSWGSGIEEQVLGFVKFTCRPWIERVESSWSRNMLTFQPDGSRVRFDLSELERGNMANQADYFTKMHMSGFVNANEVREKLGLEPYDDGDKYYFQTNTAPIGDEPIKLDQVKVDIGQPTPVDGAEGAAPLADQQDTGRMQRVAPRLEVIVPEPVVDEQRIADLVAAQTRDTVAGEVNAAVQAEQARAAEQRQQFLGELERAVGELGAMIEAADDRFGDALRSLGEMNAADLQALRDELAKEREAAVDQGRQPQLREITLPSGDKALLLIDGDSRTLQLPDGRKVTVNGL